MKKLTKEKLYEIMDNFVAADSVYRELIPYLADEQQAEQHTYSPRNQSLFNYMHAEHGVTLLETDMDEIIHIVQGMQPTNPDAISSFPSKDEVVNAGFNKATLEGYNHRLVCKEPNDDIYYTGWMDCYEWMSHQIARTPSTALGSTTLNQPTKPEPSRLEVAAILANGLGYQYGHANEYLDMADELIKQSKS